MVTEWPGLRPSLGRGSEATLLSVSYQPGDAKASIQPHEGVGDYYRPRPEFGRQSVILSIHGC